jgi:hypothetical protein
MGVVLIQESIMLTDYNLSCLASSLPQRTGTTSISHTSSHKIKQPYVSTNQTHSITHVSRVHDNTVSFSLEGMKHKIKKGHHLEST